MNNEQDIQKFAEEKRKQIAKFHYSKKEQVELTSIWNQANRLVQLEIEVGKDKRYFNEDGTINKFYLDQRLNEIMDFLMKHFISREISYRSEYFNIRGEIKDEQLKND